MYFSCFPLISEKVALLAEGVDRNSTNSTALWALQVALLAEGVDRNSEIMAEYDKPLSSPSSRRAWIEIARP